MFHGPSAPVPALLVPGIEEPSDSHGREPVGVGVRDAVDVDRPLVDRDRVPRQPLRCRCRSEFTAPEVVPLLSRHEVAPGALAQSRPLFCSLVFLGEEFATA